MPDLHKKFRFREFPVYQDARKFVIELKRFSKKEFPHDERFGLVSQLWRALDSIILNIAEGADRSTDKDFAHFLNQAHTSLNEVVACLDIALDINYINKDKHAIYLSYAATVSDQITAFRRHLLTTQTK